jgi:hypothetical protein
LGELDLQVEVDRQKFRGVNLDLKEEEKILEILGVEPLHLTSLLEYLITKLQTFLLD